MTGWGQNPDPFLSARMSPSAECGHGPREHPLVKLFLLLSATAATHTVRQGTGISAGATRS